jgi:thiol-disulfide isomerase/thioredoxin
VTLMVIICVRDAGSLNVPQIAVKDTAGVVHDVIDGKSKATVLFFITNDCPISDSYAPEINRIISMFSGRQVAFYVVYVDPTVAIREVEKHARAFGYQSPLLVDSAHRLVRLVGATVTPEAAILGPKGELLYLGRIDDLYFDFGKRRSAPTRQELRDALNAILSGQPVVNPATKPIGCFVASQK